jgi:hypothetical protein
MAVHEPPPSLFIFEQHLDSKFFTKVLILHWYSIEFYKIELSSNCLIFINLFGVVQVEHFGAYYLMKKGSSKFTFSTSSSMKDIGVDVASDEWLQNFITWADQAMNGQKPWRGPREMSLGFWQMLIEASTLPSDIVLECTTMTDEASSIRFGLWKWFIA